LVLPPEDEGVEEREVVDDVLTAGEAEAVRATGETVRGVGA